jgi:uncharacterized protein
MLAYVHNNPYSTNLIFWVLTLGGFALSGLISLLLRRSFSKWSEVNLANGMTGAEVAQRILAANGLHGVGVHPTPGALTDHYDPTTRSVHLSEPVYYGRTVSAAGVAAHEVGHALQHQAAYAPLHARSLLVKTQGIASQILMWVPLLGMAGGLFPQSLAIKLMVVGYGLLMLFQLVTLPVEFDATRRAKIALGQMSLVQSGREASGVSSVLGWAAMTYVAAFVTTLAWFIFYVMRMLGSSSRNDE